MESAQNPPSTNDRHLGAIFFRRVAELGDRTFVKLQRGERFEEISWRDFGGMVQNVSWRSMPSAWNRARGLPLSAKTVSNGCADLATLAGGMPNVVVSLVLVRRRYLRSSAIRAVV
jgi:hypothetical protein